MIWIDIATPKYALFFSRLIPLLDKKILVTTRYSQEYSEAKEILDKFKIKHYVLGNYGGKDKKDKFLARLERSKEFVELFEKVGYPKLLINGAVVDSTQTAFGLGIKNIIFYDTPVAMEPNYQKINYDLTPVSKLTLPFADVVYYPFVLPKKIYEKNCIKNAISYVTYPPKGQRGFALARAQGFGYDLTNYKRASKNIKIVVQIETIEAINNLEEILKVKGLHSTLIGPRDLSGSIGKPGDYKNKKFIKALQKYEKLSKQNKVSMGMHDHGNSFYKT